MGILVVALGCGTMLLGRLFAQAAEAPVKLAIITEAAEFARVADLLTAELSRDGRIALVERTEIERVLREQALSATGRDYLKLGQLLKADGLLIAERFTQGGVEQLGLRLVAVRPGVVLGVVRAPQSADLSSEWARGLALRFEPLIPKLGVLVQDATPVSVVNLRSALRSREGEAFERELIVLLIERLSREKQLFVLERRSMEALVAENDLKGMDDSEFWSGSYLLEGTLDRDGYSRERLTVALADRCRTGLGTGQDYFEAAYWYCRAAEAKVASRLADTGKTAKAVSPVELWVDAARPKVSGELEFDQAFRTYLQAAKLRNAEAEFRTGDFYSHRNGPEHSKARAFFWYDLAAGQGMRAAMEKRDALKNLLTSADYQQVGRWKKELNQSP